MKEFNINSVVFVQLTDAGRAANRGHWDDLKRNVGDFLGEYVPPKEDADGWSQWQMWVLMEQFGHMVDTVVYPLPFATTIRMPDKCINEVEVVHQ